MMLLSQALMHILIGKGNGRLPVDLHELPEGSIIAALWEILICTLQTQKEDGSWENIREVKACSLDHQCPHHPPNSFSFQRTDRLGNSTRPTVSLATT